MDKSEQLKKGTRFIANEMRDIAHQFCVPIIAVQEGRKPAQCGTGTLFQVANRYFLVSAGHIVQEALKGQAILFSTCATGSPFIPIDSRRFYTPPNESRWGDKSGPFDIAIWPLSDGQVEAFSESKRFANNSLVAYYSDLTRLPQHELFYVCGYPTALAVYKPTDDRNLVLEPIRWVAGAQLDRSKWPDTCEPMYHIVLNTDLSSAVNSDGDSATPPAIPKGISGCSVWALGWDPIGDSWIPTNARIVGIETRVYPKQGAMRATGWVGVRSILMREYPELGRAFFLDL